MAMLAYDLIDQESINPQEAIRQWREEFPDYCYKNTLVQRQAMQCITDHSYTLLVGGAGSGKTVAGIRRVVLRALRAPNTDHLIIRKELTAARASIWAQGLPEVMAMCFPNVSCHWNNKDSVMTLPNGSKIRLGSASDRKSLEKILGQQQSTIYINEASEVLVDLFHICQTRLRQKSVLRPKLILDCNPPFKSHFTYKYFYLKQHMDGSPVSDPENYGYVEMHPRSNAENLDEAYLQSLEKLPPRMKKRFYDGAFADDAEGALWRQSDIDSNRVPFINFKHLIKEIPQGLTVVAIDPATSKTEDSDLTGVVAVSAGQKIGRDGREDLYVLADRSIKGTPYEWAEAAIKLYDEVDADLIVAEKNQGGDMVEAILRSTQLKNKGFKGKVKLVHASKGKMTRAEPIEALYEQGFVHHLDSKELSDLEEQMTGYVPHMLEGKDASPDRMDALVWGLTYLTAGGSHAKAIRQLEPEKIKKAARRAAQKVAQRSYGANRWR